MKADVDAARMLVPAGLLEIIAKNGIHMKRQEVS
jgi:hypothetical protein